jgi:hypothetical protein
MTSPDRQSPSHVILDTDKSHPLAVDCARAGATIFDLLWLGLSPIAFACNEEWQPLLAFACEKAGYCWEWVPTETLYPRRGDAVLTKVES